MFDKWESLVTPTYRTHMPVAPGIAEWAWYFQTSDLFPPRSCSEFSTEQGTTGQITAQPSAGYHSFIKKIVYFYISAAQMRSTLVVSIQIRI